MTAWCLVFDLHFCDVTPVDRHLSSSSFAFVLVASYSLYVTICNTPARQKQIENFHA